MSYRTSQLSPQGTNAERFRVVVQNPPTASPAGRPDMQFWRSWIEFDSNEGNDKKSPKLNWSAVLGLMVVVGISACFWAGLGLLIARVVR